MTSKFDIADMAAKTRIASREVAQLTTTEKDNLLLAMAAGIEAQTADILKENEKDIQTGRDKGLSDAMLDRLLLTEQRIKDIADAMREIVSLADPVGSMANVSLRPNGMQVGKMRIPLGVIAMIYEARPNVTAEAAALCIKSGNAVILRGGSEAIHSNLALAECLHKVLTANDLNKHIVSVIPDTSRTVIEGLLTQRESIDLVIPRGGEGLIRYVTENSQIPVIQHFKGVCHLFVDKFADLTKATNILVNGKTQRPSACNSLETLLVHQDIAEQFLPIAAEGLAEFNVKVHACELSKAHFVDASLATDEDFHAEYLAQEIAVRVVESYDDAIEHINKYGSHHTDSIITENYTRGRVFITAVDSSSVMINASTRFADGFEYGLGAEIGISTDKIHARGPVGLDGLTSQKYVVFGDGHIRQ